MIKEQETGLLTAVICRRHGNQPVELLRADCQGIVELQRCAASNLWKMKTPNLSACWRRQCWTMPF
ncbi:MAG: hypothetical protein HRT36_07225 [Alphaproteobacteria bacterium]|nr:hypothetical protein [Alphaproteobacteria bacterium]